MEAVFSLLDQCDLDEVLVMSVCSGFGGQVYLAEVEKKVMSIRCEAPWIDISIDGGIDDCTVTQAAAAGCTQFISGSFIFNHPAMSFAIEQLRSKAGIRSFIRGANI